MKKTTLFQVMLSHLAWEYSTLKNHCLAKIKWVGVTFVTGNLAFNHVAIHSPLNCPYYMFRAFYIKSFKIPLHLCIFSNYICQLLLAIIWIIYQIILAHIVYFPGSSTILITLCIIILLCFMRRIEYKFIWNKVISFVCWCPIYSACIVWESYHTTIIYHT